MERRPTEEGSLEDEDAISLGVTARYGAKPESNERREMEEALVEHSKGKVLEAMKQANCMHEVLAENDCDANTVFEFLFMSKLVNFSRTEH